MKIKETNNTRKVVVQIDPSLNKYKNVILFPEKVAQAKETINRIGLPKLKEKDK